MAKQAAKKPAAKPKAAPKPKKVTVRTLSIAGVRNYPPGTEITKEIEDQWAAYYKRTTGGAPLRSLDWYC